ncbi:MAG: hypothetical protein KDA20_05015 [Phycisphaerales bacterium]|nr:hypothetical protein [Phycisphaerales bacterium]
MFRSVCAASVVACALTLVGPVVGQHDGSASATAVGDAKTVNAMCPIGKEPIVPSAGAVEYKGHQVGLCCPGCGKQFLAWDEARKDEFIALAIAHREPGQEKHAAPIAQAMTQDDANDAAPYLLDTCPVSGGKLGSMGDPIVKQYDGREVRFCCAMCVPKFEADKAGYFAKIDEQIVKDQMPFYPTDKCVVSGELLDEASVVNVVQGNRLVRLCCNMCKKQLAQNPEKYLAKLDAAVVEAQRAEYPLDTCPVSGGKLGSMGDPVEMVVGGRLVRLCCASCEPKVNADPLKFVHLIDEAWHAKGKFKD